MEEKKNAKNIAFLLHAEAINRKTIEVQEVDPKPEVERQVVVEQEQEQEQKSDNDNNKNNNNKEAPPSSPSSSLLLLSSSIDFTIEPRNLAATPVPAPTREKKATKTDWQWTQFKTLQCQCCVDKFQRLIQESK